MTTRNSSPAHESPLIRLTFRLSNGHVHSASVHSTLGRSELVDELQLKVVADAITCCLGKKGLTVLSVETVDTLAWEMA